MFLNETINMPATKRVLLVVNPISGNTAKSEIKDRCRAMVGQMGGSFREIETTGQSDAGMIGSIIDSWRPSRVLVAGGDGLVNIAATALYGKDLPLGIIPAGSGNGMAASIGLPQNLGDQIRVALGDSFINSDILKVNGRICVHLADVGLNAEVVKNFEEFSIRGKLGYALQIIPSLINQQYPFDIWVEIDGQRRNFQAVDVFVANAGKFGSGAEINPHGSISDGRFEVLVFKSIDVLEMTKTLWRPESLNPDFVEMMQTGHAIIGSNDLLPFQVDGEALGGVNQVEAKILPDKLPIAVPA